MTLFHQLTDRHWLESRIVFNKLNTKPTTYNVDSII